MALDDLLATLERRPVDTPDTWCNLTGASGKRPLLQGCTLDTPDTHHGCHRESNAPRVGASGSAANAEILEWHQDSLAAEAFEPTRPRPADERLDRVLAKFRSDPSLRYAMEAHTDIDPDAAILTVAIRGKGACELRITSSAYDPFALLELIERRTARDGW